jgi:transposase
MSKYLHELKLEIVLYVIEGNHSQGDAVRKYGIAKSQVQKWIKLYQNHGVEGLMIKHGTYTGDFKIAVVEYMHNCNASIFDTAAKFGIPSPSTLQKWERIYYERGYEGLYEDKRGRPRMNMSDKPKKQKLSKEQEEDLIAEVQRLRMENAYLKKLNALVQEREKSVKKTK